MTHKKANSKWGKGYLSDEYVRLKAASGKGANEPQSNTLPTMRPDGRG